MILGSKGSILNWVLFSWGALDPKVEVSLTSSIGSKLYTKDELESTTIFSFLLKDTVRLTLSWIIL